MKCRVQRHPDNYPQAAGHVLTHLPIVVPQALVSGLSVCTMRLCAPLRPISRLWLCRAWGLERLALFPVKRRSGEQTRQDLQVSRFRIFLNEDRLFLNMEITNTESHLWNSTRKKKSQKRNGLRGLDKVSKFEIILSSCIQNYREKQSSRRSKHVNQRGDSTF